MLSDFGVESRGLTLDNAELCQKRGIIFTKEWPKGGAGRK